MATLEGDKAASCAFTAANVRGWERTKRLTGVVSSKLVTHGPYVYIAVDQKALQTACIPFLSVCYNGL